MKHHDGDIEEEYGFHDRKAGKKQRKIESARDRSKFKKTDQSKYLKSLEKEKESKLVKEELLEGRVLSITPQSIIVEWNHQRIHCVLKGLLKRDDIQLKNLVTVGDFVLFEHISEGEGVISHVKPRFSVLSRAETLSQRKQQIIAANIDQVLITVSVVNPVLKPSLVDRYIIAARKGGMAPVIIVNKIDLLENSEIDPVLVEVENEVYQEFVKAYTQIGIPIIAVSVHRGDGLSQLREIMSNKASVFSGQSGVGKSSLINAIAGLRLRIGDVVDKTKKGSHTTTTAQLIPLDFGGWCIDTPGIKSFGVWNLKHEEIERYFSEIYLCGRQCKFPNCTHSHEEDCAVIAAVEKETISLMRYDSYRSLMASIGEKHVRR